MTAIYRMPGDCPFAQDVLERTTPMDLINDPSRGIGLESLCLPLTDSDAAQASYLADDMSQRKGKGADGRASRCSSNTSTTHTPSSCNRPATQMRPEHGA